MNKFKTKHINILCFIIGPILITYNFFVCFTRLPRENPYLLGGAYKYGRRYYDPDTTIFLIIVGVALVCWGFLRHYWKKNKLGGVHSGIDPTIISDLAIVGAHHIESGKSNSVRNFTDWSIKMVDEFGEEIKPHLQEIWDKSREVLKKEIIRRTEGNLRDKIQKHKKPPNVAPEVTPETREKPPMA